MEPIRIIHEFINERPIMAGYIALMLAVTMTGRWKFVVLGIVFGFTSFYCYCIGTATARGLMGIHQMAIAAVISITLVICAVKLAFR